MDFYCHAAGLAIEIDGDTHRNQFEYDQARDEHLKEVGVRVIRFKNEEVLLRIDTVLLSIIKVCKAPILDAKDTEAT